MRRGKAPWSWLIVLVGVAIAVWLQLGSPVRAQVENTPSQSATTSADGYFLPEYQDPGEHRAEENPVASAISFLLKFGGVLGLIYGVAWLYKRGFLPKGWLPGGGLLPGAERPGLRLLESIPLKGSQSVHLLEVGDRILVVGSNGRDTMVKLSEFDSRSNPAAFDRAIARAESGEDDFSGTLDATLRQVVHREDER